MRKIVSFIALVAMVFVIVACGKKTFTVTFETNGGGTIPQAVVVKDELLTAPTAPTKAGFTFVGWYKESALTNEWKFDTDVVVEDITLYAKWTDSDQSLVDAAHAWLALGDLSGLTNQSARLILPTTRNGVTISWVIDKPAYIAANGLITQPTHEVGNQTVTLTATLTKGSITRTKAFTATVLALPSVEDTVPLMDEDFKLYAAGNIIGQEGIWGAVSGKSGNSLFTVVTSTTPAIPGGSNALKIEALTELQIEAPIAHTYDLVVIEVDLMQTTTSNGSAVNIQSSSSSPVIGFGLDGAALFYRIDNGDLMKTSININQWYTLRVEIDLVNKTLEAFYYEDGQLIPITPGKVTYNGTTPLQSLFIRSGSSTTVALRQPAYVTNLVANRIEALPRPIEAIKLGQVTDIQSTVSIEEGGTFTPSVPKVYNYYGTKQLLALTTDYTVTVNNPVDVNVSGDYTVTYTIQNVHQSSDTKVISQTVTVYSTAAPNEITQVTSTYTLYEERRSDITVAVVQPEGKLYYVLSNNLTETEAAIKAGVEVAISGVSVVLDNLDVGLFTHIHMVVELNGDSNIFSHLITRQTLVEIATAEQFYNAIHLSQANQMTSYLLLTADIDFTGYTWVVPGTTKLWTVLNGDGHRLSNLALTRTVKGGIFSDAENATIKNLIIDNVDITSSIGASAVLIGETRGNVVIENVYFVNSSIHVTDTTGAADYVGLVVARVRGGILTINNVSVVDSSVLNRSEYTGGIISGNEENTKVYMNDIYMFNFSVKEDSSTGQMVGSLTSRVRGEFVVNRVVGIHVTLDGIKNVGGLIGKTEAGTYPLTLTDIYLNGEVITFDPAVSTKGSVVGLATVAPVLNHVWVSGFDNAMSGINADPAFVISHNDTKSALWWQTNLSSIATSSLWTEDHEGKFGLNNYLVHLKPMMTVTLNYNFSIESQVVEIRQDAIFTHQTPSAPGYQFVGWFTDSDMTVPLAANYIVTGAVTLYGKYETVPASNVTFVTNVDELTVPMQEVNYNQLATAPVVADTMIGGVLKKLTGWTLGGNPFAFTTPITGNIELVAVWETVSYTVTFNGGNAVDVLYGELVTAPIDVPTHYFTEVTFKEWQLGGVVYNFTTPVTSNLALVAAFNDPVSISIDNVEEFYHMVTVESTWNYVLSADLDFSSYTWVYVDKAFKGSFDGQGHRVSHITMTGLSGYAGLFPRANGATIKNLVVDHITIQTSERAGGLVGRVENGDTVIENIMIINSSIEGGNSNGVGGLIGIVSRKTDVKNIAIINTTVKNSAVNVGGLVGRVDSAPLNAEDIFISGVTVTSTSLNTSDVAASAVVGYVRDNVNSVFNGLRIVVLDSTVDGNVTAAFVGYNRFPGTSTLLHAYFEVEFVNNERSGFIGYNRDQVVVIDQATIFGKIINDTPHSQVVSLTHSVDVQDLAWWNTNLNNITTSPLWDMYDGRSYGLKLYTDTLPPLRVVTIDFNTTHDSITQSYREGMLFDQNSPVLLGYNFLGWFSDEALTTALPSQFIITAAVTVYAKYEAVPPSQVSFVTNVDGLTVPTQDVNYGLLATLPVVANQMIEGILKEVTGWTLNGNPFAFETPITGNIELVAVWETVTYTVTFDGKNPVVVAYGEVVSEPEEDPVHIFQERAFVEWRLGGTAYDFNTPVTANINLVPLFAAPVGDVLITSTEQFYTMATVESTYSYKLANDLDFTSYAWTYVNTSFKGTFDGQGFTISNLSMTGLTGIAGIFPRANGATIKNLVVDNLTIQSSERAGGLVGRVENGDTLIENIVIKNSSITGNNANGVGGLIGLVSRRTEAYNIAVINTLVTNTAQLNVGGLVGRVDSAALYADDIFISNVTVKSGGVHATNVGAGALVGYVRDNANSLFSGVRVVVWNTTVDGGVAGAFIGRLSSPGQADLMDAYFKVTFINHTRSELVAYNQGVTVDTTSIFGSFTNNLPAGSNEVVLTKTAVPTDSAWWTTNINSIATSDFWVVNADGSVILALLVP